MTSKKMSVSIVLPTYNEKKNIEILIPQIEEGFKDIEHEIIVVDDSSPDGTADAARKLNKEYGNIFVVLRPKLEGIGAALRDGYDVAQMDIILSSDSDLSFSVTDMLRLVSKIQEGFDMVVGSRHMGGDMYEMKKSATRRKGFISKFGNIVNKTFTGVNIHDFTANFRATRREVWQAIKTRDKTNFILAEMIILAYYLGHSVTEIPVHFKDRIHGESKLRLAREIPKFIWKITIFSFRMRLFKNARKNSRRAKNARNR